MIKEAREARQMSARRQILRALKKLDTPPEDALGVLISLVGTVAATGGAGVWKTAWATRRAVKLERRRLRQDGVQ